MAITNLLAETSFMLKEISGSIEIGFLEQFIDILVTATGITGVGIILYCLILKVVVLPLDVWQKISMRKQNLKMESMRGSLEKLKEQYANNPELYQKKIQEVYKENNFNMMSSCLPMIAMMVVLIVAFQSLTAYSEYKNLNMYVEMSKSYNTAVLKYYDPDANVVEDWEVDKSFNIYKSEKEDFFIYAIKAKNSTEIYKYTVDVEKMQKKFPDANITEENAISYVTEKIGGKQAAKTFENYLTNEGASFLWTKNIFYPDVYWSHPIGDYQSFCSSITRKVKVTDSQGNVLGTKKIGEFITEATYNDITSDLGDYKNQPNGIFVLVALTIIANLGSQFLTMRSQKAQRELQSADKSQESMQKWMMFLMPAMFCYFAFIYSGAFSLYLITSSLFSTLSMLAVNKIIDVIFKKKEAEKAQIKISGRQAYSRDWEKNKQIDEKINKYNNKKGK